jgi:hypothetical protein
MSCLGERVTTIISGGWLLVLVNLCVFLIAETPEIEVIGAVTRGGAHTGLGIFVSSTGFASANLGA